MLDIRVLPPAKTDSLYAFRCVVRPARSRVRNLLRSPSDASKQHIKFGYRALTYTIRHHEVWDGLYPLLALTRHGGPLFDTGHDRARIRFTYPIAAPLPDFFVQRAADNGIEIEVEADLSEVRMDQPTSGDVLAFGGGKDSRLLLGMLRERGAEPTVISAKADFATDIPGALLVTPIQTRVIHRIMPSFMHLGRHLYIGGGFGDTHLVHPWHEYYDIFSAVGRRQLTDLLGRLGIQTEIRAPLVVLPFNLTQRILSERYPELYAGQMSTKPGAPVEKSLHVALLELYHGLPYTDRIEASLFQELLAAFVSAQLAEPAEFGARDHRQLVRLEMRAIIWRRREHPALAKVRHDIPPDWDGPWIDYIHDYADPDLDDASLALFKSYAPTVGEALPERPVERFPV